MSFKYEVRGSDRWWERDGDCDEVSVGIDL